MRISPTILNRFITVPQDLRELRKLLDESGLEVKRVDEVTIDSATYSVFDLELLSNRGDHYCYAGVAREIFGRIGGKLEFPKSEELTIGDCPISVNVESEQCLYYSATLIEIGPNAGTLPPETVLPVLLMGTGGVSAVVDVSNLVNIELGHPIHIFDADAIVGGIAVRGARAGETAHPLFHEKSIELPIGTLVVADAEKVLAIAGVIGCEESKATATSTRLLVESAVFDPVSVRIASRRLSIRTDSSARFERGADSDLVLGASGRAIWLLEQYCGGKRLGGSFLHCPSAKPERVLELDPEAARSFLNLSITNGEISERLTRYGFNVSGDSILRVGVPQGRFWDVEFVADLYEELAKSVGYDTIPSTLPGVDMGSSPSEWDRRKRDVSEVFCGEGFFEIFTDSFYGRETLAKLELKHEHPLNNHVQVLGSLDKGHSLLKNNALIQMAQAVAQNLRMREDEIKLFEWTRLFFPATQEANGICEERELLAAVCCGHVRPPNWAEDPLPADSWYLKGIVSSIAQCIAVPLTVGAVDPEHPLYGSLHPERQAAIKLGERTVGILGEIHPRIVELVGIKRTSMRPCYIEIESAALQATCETGDFREPPNQPPTIRHLAFTLPFEVEAGEVLQVIRFQRIPGLDRVDVIDAFQHNQEAKGLSIISCK